MGKRILVFLSGRNDGSTNVLCDEFNLDTKDRTIIEAYLKATETERENIKNFLLSIAENLQKKGR